MCFKRKQQQNEQGKCFISFPLPLCTTEECSGECTTTFAPFNTRLAAGELQGHALGDQQGQLVFSISSLSGASKAWALWAETRTVET